MTRTVQETYHKPEVLARLDLDRLQRPWVRDLVDNHAYVERPAGSAPAGWPSIHRAADGAFEGPGAHPTPGSPQRLPVLKTEDGREWHPRGIKHGPWVDMGGHRKSWVGADGHKKSGYWRGEPREVVFRHDGQEQHYRFSWFDRVEVDHLTPEEFEAKYVAPHGGRAPAEKRALRYKDAA
jgi:hypothetical protein